MFPRQLKPVIFFSTMFLIVGSCIPDKNSIPYKNFVPYAFEMVRDEKIIGIGHMMFLVHDNKGFIFMNYFSEKNEKSRAPVAALTEVIEAAQIEERSTGLYILIGKNVRGNSVVGTLRRGPSGFPYLEDWHHLDYQITVQQPPPHVMRPLSKHGMVFYRRYLQGIDLGESPTFTKYKFGK